MKADKFYEICDKVENMTVPEVEDNFPKYEDILAIDKSDAEYFVPILAYVSASKTASAKTKALARELLSEVELTE